MLYAEKDKKPMERLKFTNSLISRAAISSIFRILDFVFPGRGDCLKVILIK